MAPEQTPLLEDDDLEEELEDNPAEFASARKELTERCKASNITVEENDDSDEVPYLTVFLPAGREKRRLHLFDSDDIKALLSIPFERMVFLGNYDAICSYTDGTIEAAIRSLTPAPPRFIVSRLLGGSLRGGPEAERLSISIKDTTALKERQITIGPASDHFGAVAGSRYRRLNRPTVTITGISISQHDQALKTLERITNSAFFQIDLAFGLSLSLVRERRIPPRIVAKREPTELQFPVTEYDEAPMALYWYGRSATGMPLLQFLAYYQTIEFYFPTYSQAEARRRIRTILKDPSFRSDRDADLGRVLTAAKAAGSFGFGDERNQLRATIHECLNPQALREFLSVPDRLEFFSSRQKSLTDVKIPINNANADLRADVADRIL